MKIPTTAKIVLNPCHLRRGELLRVRGRNRSKVCNTYSRAIVLFVLVLLPSVAHAEARFALLIGNQPPSVGILKNPYNDIAVVGDALAKQGFTVLPPIARYLGARALISGCCWCGPH